MQSIFIIQYLGLQNQWMLNRRTFYKTEQSANQWLSYYQNLWPMLYFRIQEYKPSE